MILIYCPACDRSRFVEQIIRRPTCCGNCGARPPIIVRKIKTWHGTAPIDGIERIEAMRQAFAGLAYWAAEKRYQKPVGWIRIKFKTLFGVWPGGSIELTPPAPIRAKLVRWIEKQNARYSVARRKEQKMAGVCRRFVQVRGRQVSFTVAERSFDVGPQWETDQEANEYADQLATALAAMIFQLSYKPESTQPAI